MSEEKKSISEKIKMAKSYAQAIISRGITNKKTDKLTKQLRVISCFGDGGELIPCEYLAKSKTDDTKNICGGCGCGDRKGTWLQAEGDEYSKLDYPNLNCPLQMPGFTNYEQSAIDEAEEPVTRRYYIEEMGQDRVERVEVSLPEKPEKPKPKESKE